MRLSWNEIRARAARFAQEWQDAGRERSQTHLFYRDFFDVFGVSVRRVASFEEPVKRLGEKRGFIDLFWKGMLLVEQKSAGRDLRKAKAQALDYFPGLGEAELPRYLLLSDFQTFELHDLGGGGLDSRWRNCLSTWSASVSSSASKGENSGTRIRSTSKPPN